MQDIRKISYLKNLHFNIIKSINSSSRNSSVNITTSCELDGRGFGFRFPAERPDYVGGLIQHLGAFSPGVKRPGHEAGHLTPYIAKAQKVCGAKSSWRDADFIKHRSNYIYPFLVF